VTNLDWKRTTFWLLIEDSKISLNVGNEVPVHMGVFMDVAIWKRVKK
jgi:hypothetical protein